MKIAIAGKGGVGKTTISALLTHLYAEDGEVLVIDADPDPHLSDVLRMERPKPFSEMRELIKDRVGEGMLRLNPDVSGLLDRFCVKKGRIKLTVLGGEKRGGDGCFCPESIFLREILVSGLNFDGTLIVDMPAGIEHLYRATAKGCDLLLIVVEPSTNSIRSCQNILRLSEDLGIKPAVVANKMREEDADIVQSRLKVGLFGRISYHPRLREADLLDKPIFFEDVLKEVLAIKRRIEEVSYG